MPSAGRLEVARRERRRAAAPDEREGEERAGHDASSLHGASRTKETALTAMAVVATNAIRSQKRYDERMITSFGSCAGSWQMWSDRASA